MSIHLSNVFELTVQTDVVCNCIETVGLILLALREFSHIELFSILDQTLILVEMGCLAV
jgi:hypothetical protein